MWYAILGILTVLVGTYRAFIDTDYSFYIPTIF